jgi:hypothetical protein
MKMNSLNSFDDHKPGDPYNLSREQFLAFLGLTEIYSKLKSLLPGNRENERAFWAALAGFEAGRTFNPYSGCCDSHLRMAIGSGQMEWKYETTSGTVFTVTEWREFQIRSAPGYPGSKCSDELPISVFSVKIPPDRDKPGRYHYEKLRRGGSYCD